MAAWRRPRSGPASRADPSSSSPTPSSTSQASASGPRLLPRPPSPGSPAAPSSPLSPPLLELVSWATALCVSDLQQQQQQPPHMQLQPPASSSVSAAPAPLSFGWFRAVWLRSGCRLLPLLALSMQSQRSLLHSSAWGPSHDAVALTSSPLYRSCSFPSAVTRPLLLSAYDSLTHLLSQHCPLLQRALVYYALYTLHRTQLTVEKYPIPCTRHAWSTIRADVQVSRAAPPAHPKQRSRIRPSPPLLCSSASPAHHARLPAHVGVRVCAVWSCCRRCRWLTALRCCVRCSRTGQRQDTATRQPRFLAILSLPPCLLCVCAPCWCVLAVCVWCRMLVWVCAYPCRVLKEDLSDFQRRRVSSRVASTAGRATQGGRGGGGGGREGSGQGGGGVRGAIAPPAAAPIVGLQRVRQRRRWTTKLRSAPLSPLLSPSAANAAVVAQLVTAESEDSSSRHAHRADEHREEEDEEDDGEDREDRQAEEGAERECRQARDYAGSAEGGEVAAGSAESGRYARIQRQAQQRFERLAQHMAKQAADRRGRGGAADDVEQRTDDPLHLLLSPHPTTPPPSPPPPSSPRGVLGCSSPRLSAWLSSGRPLPLRSPLDASWQREVEGEAAAAEAAGASSLWRLLSAQLQEHHGGRAEPQSLMFGSLSALSAAYEVELSRLQAEAEGAGGGGERGGECDHPPSPPFTSSPSSATAAPATPPSSSPWLAHLSVGAQSLQQLTASHAHPPAASAAPPSSSAQASSPSPSPAFWQWSGERSSRRPSPPLPPLLQLLHGLDVAYHSSQQRQHSVRRPTRPSHSIRQAVSSSHPC